MADNFGKVWVQKTGNQQAISRASQAIQATGRALPCHIVAVDGALVTVAFEVNAAPYALPQVQIPKAESPWIRMPTQVGDKGVTMPADAYLGGVSGLGGGTASLAPTGNLMALVFVPVSNKSSPPIDQNAAQIEGPNGAIIRTSDGTSKIVVDESSITLTFGAHSMTIDASGISINGKLMGNNTATFSGEGTFAGGHTVSAHVHPGVQSGGSDTDPPTG